MKKKTNEKLSNYISPEISVEVLQCESSIATGSATVTPLNNSSSVQEEWETEEDVVGSQTW